MRRAEKRGIGAIEMVLILAVTLALVGMVVIFIMSFAPPPAKVLLSKVTVSWNAIKGNPFNATYSTLVEGFVPSFCTPEMSSITLTPPDNTTPVDLDGGLTQIVKIYKGKYPTVVTTLDVPVSRLKLERDGITHFTLEEFISKVGVRDINWDPDGDGKVFVGASAYMYLMENPTASLDIEHWLSA